MEKKALKRKIVGEEPCGESVLIETRLFLIIPNVHTHRFTLNRKGRDSRE